MKIEPVDRALSEIKKTVTEGFTPVVVLLTPQGRLFDQGTAKALATIEHMVLICGHYEGFDERVRSLADLELSMGDYVLTCGEIPAMAVCDAIVRLIPGVLGDEESLADESFENGLLEYPQYTRPAVYKSMRVPEVLLSGDPKKIKQWRKNRAMERTRQRRPDLLRRKERG